MSAPNIAEIAEDLRGTGQDLDGVLERHGTSLNALTYTQLDELDEIVMCCEQCGWWDETGEFQLDDDQVCNDCKGE